MTEMTLPRTLAFATALGCLPGLLAGQQQRRDPLRSPEVNADGTITFRAAVPRQEEVLERAFSTALTDPGRTNATLKLLWTACGTDDRGWFPPNQLFAKLLDERGVRHTFVITPGAHQWQVWRRNLIALAPLLFGD